ncbi:hypothetical protein F5Y13DRAFT_160865 [Hypoxylon sp. FL1857]|nr:hypothetical protein F5Y13DRAFT_160865 [Hypoxylon sp. FL1857]
MASSNSYVPAFPSDHAVDERVKKFIARFYATSDDPSKNEEWVDYFLPNAVVIIGDKSAKGTEEIRRLRQGMWEQVERRKHRPEKVFPASFEGTARDSEAIAAEYMLHGSLDVVTKSGEQQTVSWAGRAVLKEDEGQLKYALYQVYLHKKPT